MVRISSLGSLALLAALMSAHALECHPGGILFPKPRELKKSKTFQRALASISPTLDKAFRGEIRAGFDTQNTSFSLGLVSFDQPDSSTPIWEYHHLSRANVQGTKHLDRHSQYLIGSVTKAISDAILLRHNLDLDDPITRYIPALANRESLIPWENITLGALAGQLSGVVPNYGFSEYYYLKDYFETLGFPHIENSSYPDCGVIALNGPCSKEQLLKGMLISHPIAPPQSRPVYSNVAFTLLMYALGTMTNQTITELFREITVALGMPSTRPSPGDETLAVIPPVANTWGADFGDNVPGGGLVSTLADLSAFVQAILARSPVLGTPTQIRAWLQPGAFTGSPASTVGSPWEIYRPSPSLIFPSGGGHTVTILSKDGASYGYHARISLLDEYGLGIVILTAGDQSALGAILGAVASEVIPAVDAAAREQAAALYTGEYKTTVRVGNGEEEVELVATVGMDDLAKQGGGGEVKITRLTRGDKDVLAGLKEVWAVTAGQFLPREMMNLTGLWKAYPAEITRETVRRDRRVVVEEDWRMVWGVQVDEEGNRESDLPGRKIAAGDCLGWVLTDWLYYGQEPVDRLVFVRDKKTGRVVGLEVPFLRSGLMRKVGS